MSASPRKKKCARCAQLKSLGEFSPCKTGKYAVFNYCRGCHAEYESAKRPNRGAIDAERASRRELLAAGLKRCTSCAQVFPLGMFYGDPRRADGRQAHCKFCFKQGSRDRYLLQEYGITQQDYEAMLDAQDGICPICCRALPRRTNVDHCHKTHFIRAVTCAFCNSRVLPMAERFGEWLERAKVYLASPPAFRVLGQRAVPETNQSRVRSFRRNRTLQSAA